MLLALCPLTAALSQPIGWQKYVVPETGAKVDFPTRFSRKMPACLIEDMVVAFKQVMVVPI
jgi:hypothetical protein